MKKEVKELFKITPSAWFVIVWVILIFVYGFVFKYLRDSMSNTAFLIVIGIFSLLSYPITKQQRVKKKEQTSAIFIIAFTPFLLVLFVFGLPALLGVFTRLIDSF